MDLKSPLGSSSEKVMLESMSPPFQKPSSSIISRKVLSKFPSKAPALEILSQTLTSSWLRCQVLDITLPLLTIKKDKQSKVTHWKVSWELETKNGSMLSKASTTFVEPLSLKEEKSMFTIFLFLETTQQGKDQSLPILKIRPPRMCSTSRLLSLTPLVMIRFTRPSVRTSWKETLCRDLNSSLKVDSLSWSTTVRMILLSQLLPPQEWSMPLSILMLRNLTTSPSMFGPWITKSSDTRNQLENSSTELSTKLDILSQWTNLKLPLI